MVLASRRQRQPTLRQGIVPDAVAMLDLLHDVGHKVATVPQLEQLAGTVTQMAQQSLGASASSLLLLDDNGQELLFEVARGESVEPLKQVRLQTGSGIAGWVARHGKPLIVNDVRHDSRFDHSADNITGFVTRSVVCVPLIVNRRTIGVLEVLNKADGTDFVKRDVDALVSVGSTVALAIENIRLQQVVLDSYRATIKALAATIDAKDPYTRGHSERVTRYAMLGASELSLSPDDESCLEYASVLHDIGKIGITDRILTKPGSLTVDEWGVMRTHAVIGADILKGIPFLEKARMLILHHHERYDGRGYPSRLKGDAIPLGARIIAVADAFDTMTTDRSYRAAQSVEYAFDELTRCSGAQFCPVAVNGFIRGYRARVLPAGSMVRGESGGPPISVRPNGLVVVQ